MLLLLLLHSLPSFWATQRVRDTEWNISLAAAAAAAAAAAVPATLSGDIKTF